LFLGALAATELGKIDEAYKMMKIVRMKSPDYQPAKDLFPIIEEAKEDTDAIEHVTWLIYYLKNRGGKPQRLMEALPMRVFSDPRLNPHRVKVFPPKKWPRKSVVFFCGQATEPWGPDTLANGMGGSEEAIVYLSRELAKLGWSVTVFNDREEELEQDGVSWKPWTLFNPFDEFDAFVAWRNPQGTRGIKARVKGVDMHDMLIGHQAVSASDAENTDLFFMKSKFQQDNSILKDAPDKAVIVGNGIVASQFGDSNEN
jgi:hypothetical protein